MKPAERLKTLMATQWVDEDGEPYECRLLPGVPDEDLAEYETKHGITLAEPIKDLLRFSGGIEGGALEIFDFLGAPVDFYLDLKPRSSFLEIAQDGWGNSWFYDFTPGGTLLGPIFYYCHEGPIITYQCGDLETFIEDFFQFMTPPYQSPLDDVHEFRLKPIDQLNLDLISQAHAVQSGDALLEGFASRFEADAVFYDFRGKPPGFGFDLSAFQLLAKHAAAPIYAMKTRPGLFQRLTSFWRK